MKIIKSFKDYQLLLEKLKISEVRELVKLWRKAGGDKRYEQWFNGKHRIMIPFQAITTPIQVQVIKFLQEREYTDIDYINGNCKDPKNPNQQPKISKILARLNPDLKTRYDSDREKAMRAQGDLAIVVSRHAYDIASMTTDRKWHDNSCMEFRGGCNRHYVTNDVMEGSLVTYLIDKNDTNIEHPIARLLIKPFINKDDSKDVILWSEDKIYGDVVNGYKESVDKWLRKIQPNIVGNFTMNPNLYIDNNRDRMFYKWFSEYDDVFQSQTSSQYFVYKDGKCGLVDKDNVIIIPLIYDNITPTIYGDIFIIVQDGKCGLLGRDRNNKNVPILECKYNSIECPPNNYDYVFFLKLNKKCGYIILDNYNNFKSLTIVEPIYEYLESVIGKKIFIFKDSGKFGIINYGNSIKLKPIYDKIYPNLQFKLGDKIGILDGNYQPKITVDNSLIDEIMWEFNYDYEVMKNGKYGLMSGEGKIIVPCEYDRFINYRNGDFVDIHKGGKKGIYSCVENKELIPCIYDSISDKRGYYLVRTSDAWGVFKGDKLIVPCEYKSIGVRNYQILDCVKLNDKHVTINMDNGKIVEFKIDNIIDRHRIIFIDNGKRGLCDENFNIKIPAKWDYLESYYSIDGVSIFKCWKDEMTGLIDANNIIIIDPIYYEISKITKDYFSVNKNGKYGLIKMPEQKLILDFKYNDISNVGDETIIMVKDDSRYYLMNIHTKQMSKPYFDITRLSSPNNTIFYEGNISGSNYNHYATNCKNLIFVNEERNIKESNKAYAELLSISCDNYKHIFIAAISAKKSNDVDGLKDLYDKRGDLVLENCSDLSVDNYTNKIIAYIGDSGEETYLVDSNEKLNKQ